MVTAQLNHLRMSPRKVRLVADVIRGLSVKTAQNQLEFMNKRAAQPLLKLLKSAVANAENNFKLKRDNLYLKELRVDGGPTLKRWMPRAMGRATPINKRTSHILIVLDEKENIEIKKLEKREKEKKIGKDVKVVKSLDEIKEMGKKEEIRDKVRKPEVEEHKPEIKDMRREAGDRTQQHLDKLRRKEKGGFLRRVFRRKSI